MSRRVNRWSLTHLLRSPNTCTYVRDLPHCSIAPVVILQRNCYQLNTNCRWIVLCLRTQTAPPRRIYALPKDTNFTTRMEFLLALISHLDFFAMREAIGSYPNATIYSLWLPTFLVRMPANVDREAHGTMRPKPLRKLFQLPCFVLRRAMRSKPLWKLVRLPWFP